MNTDWHDLIQRYIAGLTTEEETALLQDSLKRDDAVARLYLRYMNLDVALEAHAGSQVAVTEMLLSRAQIEPQRSPRWLSWRPLTAAAAGLAIGLFSASMVFGFATFQAAVKRIPLPVFDAGLESGARLDLGVPRRPGQWGADSARVVSAENGVRPVEGQHMMRLEPIPLEKEVRNHSSRAYQVIDLRQAAPLAANTEVQVVGSFCATKSEMASRFMIRAVALDEAPEQAMKDFWPKAQSDEAVSMSQRFETPAGDQDWHAFSLKMPVPSGARTLVILFASCAPEEMSQQAAVSYLDEVQVSLITPLPVQP